MKNKLVSGLMLLLSFAGGVWAAAQSTAAPAGEREALNKASQTADPSEKIKALEQFIKDYPASASRQRAYQQIFDTYLRQSAKALEYADKAIEAAAENDRPGVLNNIAWSLVQGEVSLDRAYDYSRRGVELARKQNAGKRPLAMYLDTLAFIQYKLGAYASAEKNSREAISYLPQGADGWSNYLDYYYRLGLILAKTETGREEAAGLLATALLLGEPKDGEANFRPLLEVLAPSDLQKKKTELFRKAGAEYRSSATNKPAADARVALGYARNGVLPEEALALARKGVDALTPQSPVESVIESRRTLGLVHSYQKNPAAAVAELEAVAPLVGPWDSEFFLRLGQALEALGRSDAALETYLSGVVSFPAPKVMEPLTALYKKLNGSDSGLKERIAKLGADIASFKPAGPVKTTRRGQVVLAELFTGSECPPCVAADMAFDHLLSAYDRKGVVVVEYHLHIPAPDPMTNADTEARAKYYGVGSTPSVLFGGTELIRGGGPKAATKNRFGLYSYAIDRRLERQAAISIALDGSVQGSSVKVEASADAGATPGDLKLRIALVEEVVHFTGANGLAEHRAVVRQMIGSPAGAALAGGKGSHSATVELSGLTGTLRAYLEEFEKNPPARFSKDYRFKEKKHEIDPANLALIAFVQDDATKEVLQASYLRLAGAAKPQSSNSRSNE